MVLYVLILLLIRKHLAFVAEVIKAALIKARWIYLFYMTKRLNMFDHASAARV